MDKPKLHIINLDKNFDDEWLSVVKEAMSYGCAFVKVNWQDMDTPSKFYCISPIDDILKKLGKK